MPFPKLVPTWKWKHHGIYQQQQIHVGRQQRHHQRQDPMPVVFENCLIMPMRYVPYWWGGTKHFPAMRMTHALTFKSSLQTINDMQKHVPLVTCIDSTIPEIIICDGVRVFQISVSILSMAVSRATQGVVLLRVTQNTSAQLVFSVSNPSVAPNHRHCVWEASSPLVQMVQKLVKSIDGTFGFCDKPNVARKDDAILWFTMPLILPGTKPSPVVTTTRTREQPVPPPPPQQQQQPYPPTR